MQNPNDRIKEIIVSASLSSSLASSNTLIITAPMYNKNGTIKIIYVNMNNTNLITAIITQDISHQIVAPIHANTVKGIYAIKAKRLASVAISPKAGSSHSSTASIHFLTSSLYFPTNCNLLFKLEINEALNHPFSYSKKTKMHIAIGIKNWNITGLIWSFFLPAFLE